MDTPCISDFSPNFLNLLRAAPHSQVGEKNWFSRNPVLLLWATRNSTENNMNIFAALWVPKNPDIPQISLPWEKWSILQVGQIPTLARAKSNRRESAFPCGMVLPSLEYLLDFSNGVPVPIRQLIIC